MAKTADEFGMLVRSVYDSEASGLIWITEPAGWDALLNRASAYAT
jgi:hypothetical protein